MTFYARLQNTAQKLLKGPKMTEHSKKTERDYWLVISALSSCAIEGNEVAIKLLELHDTDHEEFLEELKERGFLRQEGIEVK